MRCPKCKHNTSKVIDSRQMEDKQIIKRRRECTHCHYRFTTFELQEIKPIYIQKDKDCELFNKQKLFTDLLQFNKDNEVSIGQLQQLVDEIYQDLVKAGEYEISLKDFTIYIAQKIRLLNEKLFIKYISNRFEYQTIADFLKFLQ